MPVLYKRFHDLEQMLGWMLRVGAIDKELYDKVLEGPFSFKYRYPAQDASSLIRALGEAKNPNSQLSMISNTAGVKVVGDTVVPVKRSDVVGMDPRAVTELIHEKLERDELPFGQGLELMEVVVKKLEKAGELDDEEATEFLDTMRRLGKLRKKLGL